MIYRNDIKEAAKESLKDLSITDKEQADELREELDSYINEQADNAVMYTKNVYNIMLHTMNDDAYLELGEVNTSQGAVQAITQMAYWAYRKDLCEAIQGLIEDLPDETKI